MAAPTRARSLPGFRPGVHQGSLTVAQTAAPTAVQTAVPTAVQTAEPTAEQTAEQTKAQTAVRMAAQMAVPRASLESPMVARTAGPTVAPIAVRMAVRMAVPTPDRAGSADCFARSVNDFGSFDGVPGSDPGHSVLSRLVSIDPAQFAEHHWGSQALLSAAADLPDPFTDLLSADAVDELVSERGLRAPFLRVAKNGSTLPDQSFTAPGGVGAGIADQVSDDKLVRLFADGATLVLQGLHRVWPPIVAFAQRLASELGHPVQANAYVTPPQNQGFSDHYDVHDVFVLQIAGEKRWQIHAPVLDSPLRDQPWTDRRRAVQQRAAEPALIEAVLRPGDCLYLPRGFLHAAVALGGVSTHLTIGVHSWTRYAVAEELMAEALRTVAADPVIRQSLALGVRFDDQGTFAGALESARSALVAALQRADIDQVARAMQVAARDTQRAAPVGPLRQLRDADAIAAPTVLRLRDHLAATLDQSETGSVVRSRAGDFPLTEPDVAPVKALLDQGDATAGDLGLDLARRLVLAGMAVVG
jgi:bifunctional lysine-specific demethylase and histidyl-hydroxylase NO66